jgi:uncharacterized protein involved in outer membrane biogenesis
MRALKIAGYVVGGLVALVVIALVLILLFVDPNDYRDDIEQLVERETGRDLTLTGDLKLSVFPWIALELGATSLGDAPGFGDEPFRSPENVSPVGGPVGQGRLSDFSCATHPSAAGSRARPRVF